MLTGIAVRVMCLCASRACVRVGGSQRRPIGILKSSQSRRSSKLRRNPDTGVVGDAPLSMLTGSDIASDSIVLKIVVLGAATVVRAASVDA